jgi:putative transposase
MTEYWTGSSTKHRIMTHLVWCPKYRRRVLIGEVARRLNELFTQCCEINHWELHELAINKDHVHLLIQTRPSEKLSEVVQLIKGGSSRVIRQEFPELEEFLWGASFWADGYFAESVGSKNETIIRRYISTQNDKS